MWTHARGTKANGATRAGGAVAGLLVLALLTAVGASAPATAHVARASLAESTPQGAALSAGIVATPAQGPAPLTVDVRAEPSGGSGDYVLEQWTFGDGGAGTGANLSYTYATAGSYDIALTVTDSLGASARAVAVVNVTSSPSAAGPDPFSLVALAPYLIGSAVTLGVLAAIAVAAPRLRPRTVTRSDSTVPPAPPDLTPPAPVSSPPTPEELEPLAEPASPRDASRRLSEQILSHLYWYGRRDADGLVTAEASQAGIAQRLRVGQNSVSRALQRLVDAGAVTVQLQHLPGAPRRIKTYTLTRDGEALARRLRRDLGRPTVGETTREPTERRDS
jgi:DNA-binding MarR family transcriptional regulator